MTKGIWWSLSSSNCCLACTASSQHDKHFLMSCFLDSTQLLARLIRLTPVLVWRREKGDMEKKKWQKGDCARQTSILFFRSSCSLTCSKPAQWELIWSVHNDEPLCYKNTSLNIDGSSCCCNISKCTVHNRVYIIYPIVFLICQPCTESSQCCIKGKHEEIDRWGGETLDVADFYANSPSIIVGY